MKPKKEKACQTDDRLGSFVLVNKQRLSKELSDFQAGVKSKEQVEANADVFFEHLRRFNLGVK